MLSDYELVLWYRKTDMKSAVGTDTNYAIDDSRDDELVIGFEGSNSKADWLIDFDFPVIPYKDMKIKYWAHRGFIREWHKCNDFFLEQVGNLLQEWKQKGIHKRITVMGHSYGGAMAILCAEDLWFHFEDERNNIHLVTIGAPRVYGFYHHNLIKKRFPDATLYWNGNDIVPSIPFAPLYLHPVKRTHIGKRWSLFRLKRLAKDHSSSRYRDALNPDLKS